MPIENLEPRHPRLDPEKVMKDEFYKKFCALKDGDSIKYKDKIYVKGGPGGDQEEELLIRAIGAGCKKPFTAEGEHFKCDICFCFYYFMYMIYLCIPYILLFIT